jgi:DNA-binding transcriptional regulator YiaG
MTTKTITRTVANRVFSVEVPAKPDPEHGTLITTEALGRAEMAIATALALEGPVHGEAFRFMRGALGMTAKALAELLGVAPETVSRWETGERDVDRGAWLTLGSLVLERAGQPPAVQVRMSRLAQEYVAPRERRVDL